MKLVLLGAPGSGKGTISQMFKTFLEIPYLCTGEIFRQLADECSPMGIKARDEYWGHGNLVPDEITNQLVKEMISKPKYSESFILDGFPRTRNQAETLDNIVGGCIPVLIEASQKILLERIVNRRLCSNKSCGIIYNIKTVPPKSKGKCDRCNQDLYQREDDNTEIFGQRLEVYNEQISGVLDYYQDRVLRVDGKQSLLRVFLDTVKIIG